jgi:sec-independent protein translocase protein TatB
MFNVGGGELLVIMLIALIVLGPQRLPDAARTVGRVMGDLRRISSGFQQELKDAFDTDDVDPNDTPRRKESVPLASAVAEVDGRPADEADQRGDDTGAETAAREGDAASDPDDAPSEAPGDTVAPAVAAALDEIVAPLPSPSPASASSPAPNDAGGVAINDPADGEGLGDERAAS